MATKYTKGKDGRYKTRVWDGTRNEDRSKRYRTISTTQSSKELERLVNEFKSDVEKRKISVTSDETFWSYAQKWYKTFKAPKEKNTYAMYENIIEKHFCVLAAVKVNDIKKVHLQMVINNALDKPRTCQQIYMAFKQVVKSAITDRLLPGIAINDIFTGIELPDYIPEEKRPLTKVEKAAISKVELSDMDMAFLYLIWGCGFRRGEALALTKFDFNFKENRITVNKAVAFDGNAPYLKDPKTKNGKRSVPIPSSIKPFLQAYTKSLDRANLFVMRNGKPMTKSSYDKMWPRIVRALNYAAGGTDDIQLIWGLTAHVFRHNYCTELCYQIPTISIDKIAKLLGDTKKMVLEVYNHIVDEKEQPDEAVDKALNF